MTPVSGVIFSISIALGVHLTTFYTNLSTILPHAAQKRTAASRSREERPPAAQEETAASRSKGDGQQPLKRRRPPAVEKLTASSR